MPPTNSTGASSHSFVPNNIKVVNKSYMSCLFVSKVWQESIDFVSAEYSLNSEQDHAFRLVANHTSSPDSDQLKMYIAGMAGMCKTQVHCWNGRYGQDTSAKIPG